jgi:hypothetical protein
MFDCSIHLKEVTKSSALRENMHNVAEELELKRRKDKIMSQPHGVNENRLKIILNTPHSMNNKK